MPDFIFNVKGLTAEDRAQWEKDNVEVLTQDHYFDWSEEDKDRAFRNAQFKNKFGKRPDYNKLRELSPEKSDSLFLATPYEKALDPIEEFEDNKRAIEEAINSLQGANTEDDGAFMANPRWQDFDSYLKQISPYYKNYKGTSYFPLNNAIRQKLMQDYFTDVANYGEEVAVKNITEFIQNEVSENQPLTDNIAHTIMGIGTDAATTVISLGGNIGGFVSAATGLDRLLGYNKVSNYFENIGVQMFDNDVTRYANKVMHQGTFTPTDDPDKAYNHLEIIKTVEEEKSLNPFNVNSMLQIAQQNGFTIGLIFVMMLILIKRASKQARRSNQEKDKDEPYREADVSSSRLEKIDDELNRYTDMSSSKPDNVEDTLNREADISKDEQVWTNKKAYNLYRYIKATYLIGAIAAIIFLIFMYNEIGPLLLIEMIVKNTPLLLYVRHKKNRSFNTEDWLIPQCFKNWFYKYLRNKAALRVILLTLVYPLFYIVPLPWGSAVLVFYILPVCLLIGLYIAVKWIMAGTETPLEGNGQSMED